VRGVCLPITVKTADANDTTAARGTWGGRRLCVPKNPELKSLNCEPQAHNLTP
jgi:hypothetical protein